MFSPCVLCKHSNCCASLVVPVTSFDVMRISLHTKMMPWQFAHLRKIDFSSFNNDHVVECWDDGNRSDYLLALKSLPCRLLSDKGCTAYNVRPYVCRVYPYAETSMLSRGTLCPPIPKMLFYLSGKDLACIEQFRRESLIFSRIVRECNMKRLTWDKAFEFLASTQNLLNLRWQNESAGIA